MRRLHRSDSQDSIEPIHSLPPLRALRGELTTAISDASVYLEQYRHDYQTRFCLWDGQSRDGRKHDSRLGGEGRAKPWDKASDTRPFTADEIVNEQVETLMSSWRRANIQLTAMQSQQMDWSSKVTQLLQWMFRQHLAAEIDRELELAAQWRQGYGLSAMGVWWAQERRLEMKEVRLEELVAAAMSAGGGEGDASQAAGMQLIEAVMDPLLEEATIAQLMATSPVLDRQGAAKMLRQLRTRGVAEVPSVYIAKNQPCWEALRPWVDVIFPVDSKSFQAARWTARRRWLTESELVEKVELEGWDEQFADELWEKKGRSYLLQQSAQSLGVRSSDNALTAMAGEEIDKNCVEVFDFYYKGYDVGTRVPVLYRTILSPAVGEELYARHEPIPYLHGKVPFVEFVRERIEKPMAESRSVPEIVSTFQNTIKTQRDATNDLAQLTVIPPLLVPLWRSMDKVRLGPAAQIPWRSSRDEVAWLQPPQWTGVADKIEAGNLRALAWYFGRSHADVPADRTQRAQAHLVSKFLIEVGEAARMTVQLCQQYMSDVQAERVVGRLRVPWQLSREDIQGQFDLLLSFDPNDLNHELAIKKLEAFKNLIVGIDTEGVVSRAKLAQIGARMIDPHIADEIVGTPEQAEQSEVEDEKRSLAMILAGVEPPKRPEGQNYALRQQVLTQELQANPILPLLIQQRPDVQAMLESRLQHLEFMAEQFGPNAQIGRVGAEPGLETLREG